MFPIFELLALGGFWFFVWIGIAILSLTIFVRNAFWIGSFWFIVACLFVLCCGTNLIPAIRGMENPWLLLWIIPGWIVAGVIVSGIKWIFYLHDELEEYEKFKKQWLKENKIYDGKIPSNLASDWIEDLKSRFKWFVVSGPQYRNNKYDYSDCVIVQSSPKAMDNADDLTAWAVYWPAVILDTIFGDILYRACKMVTRWVSGMWDRISRFIFRNIQNDFIVTKGKNES